MFQNPYPFAKLLDFYVVVCTDVWLFTNSTNVTSILPVKHVFLVLIGEV